MKNTMTTRFAEKIIELYNKNELTENLLRCLLRELIGYYIDPDAVDGIETNDGKGFKQLICYVVQPTTHQEIIETSRKINEDEGYVWDNLVEAEKMFERIWYEDLYMGDNDKMADHQQNNL